MTRLGGRTALYIWHCKKDTFLTLHTLASSYCRSLIALFFESNTSWNTKISNDGMLSKITWIYNPFDLASHIQNIYCLVHKFCTKLYMYIINMSTNSQNKSYKSSYIPSPPLPPANNATKDPNILRLTFSIFLNFGLNVSPQVSWWQLWVQ